MHTTHMFPGGVAPAPSGRDPEATGSKSEEESLRSQDERRDQVALGKTKGDRRPGYQTEEGVDEALKSKWIDSYLVHPVPVGAELL